MMKMSNYTLKEKEIQKYIVDKLLEKNDKKYIQDILDTNLLFFLDDNKEKQRLIDFTLL